MEKRKLACQGLVFDSTKQVMEESGFVRNYAVTGFVFSLGRKRSLVSRAGLDHGEKQRLMALAAGWMGGGGLEPSAGSDGTPRALRASNQRPPD